MGHIFSLLKEDHNLLQVFLFSWRVMLCYIRHLAKQKPWIKWIWESTKCWVSPILVRTIIVVIKCHNEKQLGLYWTYTFISQLIIKGNQDRNSIRGGTWGQELMQKKWRVSAYWLVCNGLLRIFFIDLRTIV